MKTEQDQVTSPPARDRKYAIELRMGWVAMALLALVLAGPWVLVTLTGTGSVAGWWPLLGSPRGPVIAPQAEKTGPWGRLEMVPIMLAPSPEFIEDQSPERFGNPWFFPEFDATQLTQFIAGLDITATQKTQMIGLAQADSKTGGMVIRPTDALRRGLSPEGRGKLYRLLACYNANSDQTNAFRFVADSLEDWAAQAQLPKQLVELMRPLVYRNGRFLFFADVHLILPHYSTPRAQVEAITALSRQSTLLVKLYVGQTSNLDELAEYWGRGGRAKDIRPLLESIGRLPGGYEIDIVHMLPGFGRRRIYSFPIPSADGAHANRDCHWTALNFFSDTPDDKYTDSAIAVGAILNDYYPIYGNPMLGDLVVFTVNGQQVIHSAVYIADDILFTKNGARLSQPWMFMRLRDMRDFYPRLETVEVRYFRRRDM